MLDTNVMISLFLFPSEKMNRLKHDLCNNHQIVLCSYIIDEMKDVVARKFPSKKNDLDDFLQAFPFIMTYTPNHIDAANYPEIRDEYDLPILVSAIIEDVDILISGDRDFSGIEIERPEIFTPTEFMKRFK